MLAIFNLIPVPPLDGSTLLFRFLAAAPGLADPAVPHPVRHLHRARGRPPASRPLCTFIYGVTNVLVGA